MSTTCSQCHYVRHAHETAPDWQCPSCGVVYYTSAKTKASAIPLGKLLIIAAILYGVWSVAQIAHHEGGSSIRGTDRVSVDGMSPADITTFATTVRPGEVVMYSTDSCTYCAEARSWLNQYGFAFTECNMDASKQCEREFMDYGGNGTPYLVVRGHHMKNGFDSVEFLRALREKF